MENNGSGRERMIRARRLATCNSYAGERSVIPVKLVKRDPWVRFLLVGSRPECRTRHPPSPDVDTNRRIEVNRARSRSGPFMQIKMFPAGKHGGF